MQITHLPTTMPILSFIAIDIPEAAYEQLLSVQKTILSCFPGVRRTPGFHITLKFLGDVDESRIADIKAALASVKFEPFEIRINGIGFFPSNKRINVVWVGITSSGLLELQKRIDNSLEGIFPREKDPVMHITLGRVKFLTDRQLLIDTAKKLAVDCSFKADGFKLKKSTLTKEGPVYEDIAVFKS